MRKPKFYILYSWTSADKLQWPAGWHQCRANIPGLLQNELKTKSIGGELKLIWNEAHRRSIIDSCKVTSEQIDDYVKAKSGMLSFTSKVTRNRAAKALSNRGMVELIFVEDYRDVIVYQSHFNIHGQFPGSIANQSI